MKPDFVAYFARWPATCSGTSGAVGSSERRPSRTGRTSSCCPDARVRAGSSPSIPGTVSRAVWTAAWTRRARRRRSRAGPAAVLRLLRLHLPVRVAVVGAGPVASVHHRAASADREDSWGARRPRSPGGDRAVREGDRVPAPRRCPLPRPDSARRADSGTDPTWAAPTARPTRSRGHRHRGVGGGRSAPGAIGQSRLLRRAEWLAVEAGCQGRR